MTSQVTNRVTNRATSQVTGRVKIVILALGLLLFGDRFTPSRAQTGGDVENGYRFAKRVCAECHAVEKKPLRLPTHAAPSFLAIAQSPGMSPIALSVFLRTSHETMPNIVLSTDEIADVVAYIGSLKE